MSALRSRAQSRAERRGELRSALRPFAIISLALIALASLPRLQPPAVRADRASGHIVANEIWQWDPARYGSVALLPAPVASANLSAGVATSAGASGSECLERAGAVYDTALGSSIAEITSGVLDAGQRFNYVGAHWRAPAGREDRLVVEVRASVDGTTWGDWIAAPEDEDLADAEHNERYAGPYAVGDARYAQYRVRALDGDTSDLASMALTFLDVSDLNAPPLQHLLNDLVGAWQDFLASFSAAAASNPTHIYTRQDWGADESLMQWIPEYDPWKKAIVHHTVTTNGYTSAAPEIRSIYYFHAITRGWGDIGYNYVVDKYGNIWTGRQGGDDVIGGHAYGWNHGSMGVASLGDFSTATPPQSLLNGVATIIAMKFAQRGIQPFGADTFTHKEEDSAGNWVPVTSNPPNIQGHRDASYVLGVAGGQTACPGAGLYPQLNTIRQTAQTLVNGGFTNLPFINPVLPPTALAGASISVPVTITNRGANVISAAANRLSYAILNGKNGQTVVAQGALTNLSGDIAPGTSQVVVASLNVPSLGQYVIRWGLQQVGGGWWKDVYGTPWRDQWLAAVEWDDSWVSDTAPATMTVGQNVNMSVTVKNTGARAWPAANIRLSYHWVSDVTQRTVVWNGNRANLPFDVQPGQQVTIPITVAAPSYPTRYQLQFDLVWEGQFWFGDKGVEPLVKIVNVPFDFGAAYSVPQSLTLTPDQRITVPVTVQNTSTSTWPASGTPFVELGTHWLQNGAVVEFDGMRTPLPQSLGPGQSAPLQANVDAPSKPGIYQLQFDLALEGISWFTSKGVPAGVTNVTVKAPTYGAQYAPGTLGAVAASVTTVVPMTVTNTSDFGWTSPQFALSYHIYDSSNKLVVWDGVRTQLAATIVAGQSAQLQAVLALPSAAGSYIVKWDMVQEGVAWFSQKGVVPAQQAVTIGTLKYGASYDASQTPSAMATRMTTRVLVNVINSSSFTFSSATNVYLSYHWLDGAGNAVIWDGKRSALNVPSGGSAWVWVDVVGPQNPGAYRLAFDLVQEGVTWFSGRGIAPATRGVNVVVVPYGALYTAPASASGAAGSTITVPVTLTNTGSLTWSSGSGWYLAYHIYLNGAVYVWDGARTTLPNDLAKDQSALVNASVKLPATPGAYEIRFDVVQEGTTWLSGQGVPTGNVTVTAN
jgi:hypothetical protein